MATALLKFSEKLTASDPEKTPVLIIAQSKHLSQLSFSDIKIKLDPRVSEELFQRVIENTKPGSSETYPLYLDSANLVILPKNCSRHNTPSRAHAITKLVKNGTSQRDEFVVIVCEKRDAFASACAVARAFPLYSRKSKGHSQSYKVTVEFIIVNSSGEPKPSLSPSDIECLSTAAEGVRMAARIVDTPCSEMNTDTFLEEVRRVGKALSITPHIIRGEELREKGLGGIYAVGKAAAHPPALAVLSYTPSNATETVALVGKGIVYDTGGLCIKSKNSMTGMKRDCGGAAAILEAFYVAVKLGFRYNLHAVLCLAENSVGPNALRPDDIITMYSGRTVEVNNTDAEGRLVLGDGVCYAEKDLKASIIVDMATLTGAQGTATGKYHAAIITNSEEWEHTMVRAGQLSGDLVHPLPYSPELHFSEFGSALADMKNSVADRSNAQPSCAGLFIGVHLGFDFPGTWIHIDMASPANVGERATGYGVSLLVVLFGHASKNSLLQLLSPIIPPNGPEPESVNKKMKFF